VAELGYPGFSGEGWGGVVVVKGTPDDVVMKVSNDLRKVLNDPAVQQRSSPPGLMVDNQPRDEWIAFASKTLVGGATWRGRTTSRCSELPRRAPREAMPPARRRRSTPR
jgi:hypothetical protein